MEEFYVGYAPKAPPRIGLFIRRVVAGVLVLVFLLAVGFVYSQRGFARSRFEFGTIKSYVGSIDPLPWPALVLADGRSFWLVGQGKQAATALPAGRVKLEGTLIERNGVQMLEVASAGPLSGEPVPVAEVDLGPVTVTGEIVDTKCHLGVMNPGDGKAHRDCAIRCLLGGIPAALATRDGHLYFLTGKYPARPAEPVTLRGRAVKRGDRLLLRTE